MESTTVGAGAERSDELDTNLRRAIGPGLLTVFVVGDILGAGIYALVGEVGAEVGGAIWTAFMAAFVLAVFTAFAYAELVSKYPRAAGPRSTRSAPSGVRSSPSSSRSPSCPPASPRPARSRGRSPATT